jgi:hypothetical protein
MQLEITDSERDFLIELVDSATRTIVHELDHTDTREYRKKLHDRIRILEHLTRKMQEPQEAQNAPGF